MNKQEIMYVSVINLTSVQKKLDEDYVVVSVTPIDDRHIVVVIERRN